MANCKWNHRSCLINCPPGIVGGMKKSHYGTLQSWALPGNDSKLSNHSYFYYSLVVKVLLNGELIPGNHLEENGYFIFLLFSAPHSLLSPSFNFWNIYLEGRNYTLTYWGFAVSSLEGTWLCRCWHEVSSKCSLSFRVKYSRPVP